MHRPSPHDIQSSIDPVPPNILFRPKNITLAIDLMFVNRIPFLVTVSRNQKFITVEDLPNRQEGTVRDRLKAVMNLYHHLPCPSGNLQGGHFFFSLTSG